MLKTRLLDDILGAYKSVAPHMVLVLDEHTGKIVSSCSSMSDLLERGFVAIQNIDMNRQDIDLPAAYFITASGLDEGKHQEDRKKLESVVSDFSEGNNVGMKLKKRYLEAYVNVTLKLKKILISEVLAKEKRFVSSCRALNEVNIDFLSYESKVFLLNQPYVLEALSKPKDNTNFTELARLVERVIQQMVSLCVMLNEKPYVRYEKNTNGQNMRGFSVTEGMAKTNFEEKFAETVEKLPNWKPRPNPATLLFLDRTTDMAAPLTYQLTYQATCVEMLGMENDVLRVNVDKKNKLTGEVEGTEEKAFVMSEKDDVWRGKRHKHIWTADVENVSETVAFKKKSAVPKAFDSEGETKSKNLLKVIKDYPKYQEFAKRANKHNSIIKVAKEEIKKRVDVISLLQDMACSFDHEGSSISPSKLFDRVKEVCSNSNHCNLDKARVAMLYIIVRGGVTKSEEQFFEEALDENILSAVKNISHLGFNTGAPSSSSAMKLDKNHLKAMKQRLKANNEKKAYIQGNRYVTKLHNICTQLANDKLDKSAFPYTKTPPKSASRSLSRVTGFSTRRSNRSHNRKNTKIDSDNPRIIVFVFGGITAAEMATAYEIGEQYGIELFVGSTDVITGDEVVKALSMGRIGKGENLRSTNVEC